MTRLASLLAATATFTIAGPVAAQSMQGMDMPGMSMPATKKPGRRTDHQEQAASPGEAVAHQAQDAGDAPGRADGGHEGDGPFGHAGHGHVRKRLAADPGCAARYAVHAGDADARERSTVRPERAAADAGHVADGAQTMPTDRHGRHDVPGMTMPGVEQTKTALAAGNAPAPAPPMDHYADRQFPPGDMAKARRDMMSASGGMPFYQVMFNLAEYQARRGRDGCN